MPTGNSTTPCTTKTPTDVTAAAGMYHGAGAAATTQETVRAQPFPANLHVSGSVGMDSTPHVGRVGDASVFDPSFCLMKGGWGSRQCFGPDIF